MYARRNDDGVENLYIYQKKKTNSFSHDSANW